MSGGRGQAVSLGGGAAGALPITVILPGYVNIAGTDIAGNWLYIVGADGFAPGAVYITARGAPTTHTLSFDVMVSTNEGGSFNSALDGSTKIDLPPGDHVNALTALIWATTQFNEGDIIRIDLLQEDPGAYGVAFAIYPA